jgi:putative ABC transport system permease protein
MGVAKLVLNEILHRRLNFVLTLFSVTIAIACLVGSQTLLSGDELLTQELLAEKRANVEAAVAEREAAVKETGKALEDAIRKQMLGLGFNVLIVPESQDLSELHLNGTLSETMPESYVNKLAESEIVTVNHLLPSVTRRVPLEHDGVQLDVIVQGTRGEVPIMHRALKKMLLDAVPPDTIVVGYQVAQKFGLKSNDSLTILGKDFKVTKLHPERGSSDDVTVWIDLAQAQELFGMQNVINAILALECECAGDRITQIRAEIAGILPGTSVIERHSEALARAESREQAKQTAIAALKQEQENGTATLAREEQTRTDIEDRHSGLVSVLVPLVLIGCAIWIGVLAFGNVRQRSSEIGILRAIGLSSRQILGLFLTRAIVTGFIGGLIGVVAGVAIGTQTVGLSAELSQQVLASSGVLLTVVLAPIVAPVFSAVASWIPALMAAQQDPATVLQGE